MADTPAAPLQKVKLFYCYAREDKALRDELQVNLAGLRRQYQLTNWYDREILPGEQWEEIIDKHLSTADVILLLISPHFVDSDYCYGKEMQRALERHHAGNCCVIPILLRPTYWEETPFGSIQMLPTDVRPITSWSDRYEAFHDVARGISTAIKALLTSRAHKTKEQWIDEGNTLRNLKWYEEALAAYDQAIHLDSNSARAYNYKGHVLYALGRRKEAQQAFETARQLGHEDLSIILQRIESYKKTGLLVVMQGERIVELSFRLGQLLCIGPVQPDISLADRLLQAGVISREAYREVASMPAVDLYREVGMVLTLIDLGHVSQQRLYHWALSETTRVIETLVAWADSEIYFEENQQPPSDRLLIALPISSLLLEQDPSPPEAMQHRKMSAKRLHTDQQS